MGWFVPKVGPANMKLTAKTERLCGFVHVQSPVVSKGMKRLVNPSNNILGLSVEDSSKSSSSSHQEIWRQYECSSQANKEGTHLSN